jgi:hypothetical protein
MIQISSLFIHKNRFFGKMNEKGGLVFFRGNETSDKLLGRLAVRVSICLESRGRLFVGELISHEGRHDLHPPVLFGWCTTLISSLASQNVKNFRGLCRRIKTNDAPKIKGGHLAADCSHFRLMKLTKFIPRKIVESFNWIWVLRSELNFFEGANGADNRLVIAMEEKELGRSLKGQQEDEQEEKMEIGEWSHQFFFSDWREISPPENNSNLFHHIPAG